MVNVNNDLFLLSVGRNEGAEDSLHKTIIETIMKYDRSLLPVEDFTFFITGLKEHILLFEKKYSYKPLIKIDLKKNKANNEVLSVAQDNETIVVITFFKFCIKNDARYFFPPDFSTNTPSDLIEQKN